MWGAGREGEDLWETQEIGVEEGHKRLPQVFCARPGNVARGFFSGRMEREIRSVGSLPGFSFK